MCDLPDYQHLCWSTIAVDIFLMSIKENKTLGGGGFWGGSGGLSGPWTNMTFVFKRQYNCIEYKSVLGLLIGHLVRLMVLQ